MKHIRHLADGSPAATQAKVSSMSTVNTMTSIAIVEDNDTMRQTLVSVINEMPGCRCVCACANGREALTEIPRLMPEVVLMDIHIPGESGIVCTARLTAQMPKLQVIILTIYKDIKLIFQALQAGACGYVLKRSRPEDIVAAINEVRTGGAPMTGEIARMVVRSFRQGKTIGSGTENLSAREMEILVLLTEGLSNKEIASRLNIGTGTVRTHIAHIFEKLHVRCRSEAVARYFRAAPTERVPAASLS
jgi:DNA-binding NarL/FixJ family response regulator